MEAILAIIDEIKSTMPGREGINKIKTKVAGEYGLNKIPTNAEILSFVEPDDLPVLGPLLQKKPIRTISGIAIVAVMARPHPCPGECIYCPVGENAPQSYTGEEPAALRAKRANFDPYAQVTDRLSQLSQIGHPVDKVELIVMGGTFNAQPLDYQEWFVKRCFEAMNDFGVGESKETKSLKEAQKQNETAGVRNVGMTFETRPDFADVEQVKRMLGYGVTRVELGVQTLSDSIYEKVKRGHTVDDVASATKILKDAGLKVGYHMMPGLFSDIDRDLEMFKTLFEDKRFKPDFLKIYPTLVIAGTGLYEMWKKGEYEPYGDKEAVELIYRIKKIMPKWTRTMRIQRDIPQGLIAAGVKRGDIGAIVSEKLDGCCRCIRCRDVGHMVYRGKTINENNIEIIKELYMASGGTEYFISAEDVENDALIAYLRLRLDERATVRELRVLGPMVPLGDRNEGGKQHRGWGSALLKTAEEIAKGNKRKKIVVTSAIGTREYYKSLGYKRRGTYMEKNLY
ncbi:tRNA uridine(34) 5-carboxymethylaminomethyl modification radical SAM/GNAT enzyme Elp3 [archaeon]|nr:tRNA uridine(34) 5-carboxymethylaminomethyl modification radical SAM/GNAT enzyme Elp3 [archaeon]